MKELVQLIYMTGPGDPGDIAVLLALASFAGEDGVVRGWDAALIAQTARMPEQTVRRHLKRLHAGNWIFTFGRGKREESEYLIDIKKLCRLALNLGVTRTLTLWAETRLGVMQFPAPSERREAVRK